MLFYSRANILSLTALPENYQFSFGKSYSPFLNKLGTSLNVAVMLVTHGVKYVLVYTARSVHWLYPPCFRILFLKIFTLETRELVSGCSLFHPAPGTSGGETPLLLPPSLRLSASVQVVML